MDNFFIESKYLNTITINNYPVLMVFWNLFLLATPFVFYIFLVKLWQKNKFEFFLDKLSACFLFFLWILFMPNTVYIITDIRHLLNYCPRGSYSNICAPNAWMIMFFFVYSSLGWFFFTAFLSQMKEFVKDIFGSKISLFFIIFIIPLIALGVLLGLVDRLNSWDIFVMPLAIFKGMLVYITSFYYLRNLFIFTIGLYILYFLGDFLFKDKFKK